MEIKSTFITLRLSPTEAATLKQLAAEAYHSKGGYLRHLLAIAATDPALKARLGAEANTGGGHAAAG